MKINSEFQPPTQNSYGDIDDILMWFTHRYNVTIVVDYKGEPVRVLEFPNGAILTIDIPQDYKISSFLRIDGRTTKLDNYSRAQFLAQLKLIMTAQKESL